MAVKKTEERRSDIPVGLKSAKTRAKGYEPGALLTTGDYTRERFLEECAGFLYPLKGCRTLEGARETLRDRVMRLRVESTLDGEATWHRVNVRTRDCTRALLSMLSKRADRLAGFSVTEALWDLARDLPRPDLKPGFYAEMIHMVWALEGRTVDTPLYEQQSAAAELEGREAAKVRSGELDQLWEMVEGWMSRYPHGLQPETIERRVERKRRVVEMLGASEADWADWRWHTENVGKDAGTLSRLVELSDQQRENIERTCASSLPFGVTPFYISLMDDEETSRDRAIRRQVLPPKTYVDRMVENRDKREEAFDFMGEHDTSPIDLVTRRYPGIAILKPFNTCPQICVYCQRNWEIDEVMAEGAMAPWEKIQAAVDWLGDHPAIHEVLITGGDPLLLEDGDLKRLLDMVSALPSIHRIRIGSRTPVTLPMRFTEDLADLLGSYRTKDRQVALVTHVQHPYEVNEDMAEAIERIRMRGISVYNQLVYTFYTSRRFEAALLRRLLKRVGIDPYYTFLPKGKAETDDYRVPLSRLLQEEAEEDRLLPGVTRTDEAVYNVPRLGKNYLRASQHRDLLAVMGDGTRIYEFHPWEKNIVDQRSYVGEAVPILSYIERIEGMDGGGATDYESIWYYF